MVKDQEEGQRISRRQVDIGISSIEEIKTKTKSGKNLSLVGLHKPTFYMKLEELTKS